MSQNAIGNIPFRLETLAPKTMAGMRMEMSLTHNRTGELWRSFMPRRKEIPTMTGSVLYSLQVYSPGYFTAFDPASPFVKWAAVEVAGATAVPAGMEKIHLPGGLYAVFTHRGSSTDYSTFQYIYSTWLPNAPYELDDRPHFELLGERYKNNDPDSEEEIWIPVKPK